MTLHWTRRRLARALLAALIAAATVACLCAAFVLASFGAARGWFLLLLAVPLTLGLPTTLASLAIVSFWNGPPLPGFLATCVAAGAVAQWSASHGIRRLYLRRGARNGR